jgi:hypothetical protein
MKGCPPMFRPLMIALALCASAAPASATWLQCTASGADSTGTLAFQTTSVDVGALPPARVAALKQRLAAYVAKTDAEAKLSGVECTAFDDVTTAGSHYSQTLAATARRIGWEHVTVVQPDDWLAPKDIVSAPDQP